MPLHLEGEEAEQDCNPIHSSFDTTKMKVKDKKGQTTLSNLTGIAVAIGVLIVVMTVFAILIADVGDTQGAVVTVVNETHASVATNVSFILDQSAANVEGYSADTVNFEISNASTVQILEDANFTIHANGTVDMVTVEYTGGNFNVTYSYTGSRITSGQNVSSNGLQFMTNLTSQTGLLGTVLILVIIVAIVIGAFAFRKSGGEGSI